MPLFVLSWQLWV